MAVKIRLARYGAKKNPYYHIVAANASAKRDGRYLETLGKYNPLKSTLEEKVINLKVEAIEKRLKEGAQPTAIVQKLLALKGLMPAAVKPVLTKKHLPKAKAQERLKAQQEAAEKAKEAASSKETPSADSASA